MIRFTLRVSVMTEWVIFFAALTALAATCFVVVAFFWLKNLRVSITRTLGETAGQHIHTAQRLNDSLAQIHKKQRVFEQQINALAKASARLQQELDDITSQIDFADIEVLQAPPSPDGTVH